MGDWYDTLISALGLDGHRTDVLLGIAEQDVTGLESLQARELTRVSLNRLRDGRRLLMFQFGPYAEGCLWPMPCSRGNAEALGEFLYRTQSYLPAADVTDASRKKVVEGFREWVTKGRPIESMSSLPDRHFDAKIELRLLADQRGNHTLELAGRARGGRYNSRWKWSHATASAWQKILAALRANLTEWSGLTKST